MAWVEMRWHGKGWGGRGCSLNLQHLHTVCLSPSRVQHWISTSKFPNFPTNHFSKPSGCSVVHTIWTTPVFNKCYIFLLSSISKSSFCRLSIDFYHEIPESFNTLAKDAIFSKLSKPGKGHLSFPQISHFTMTVQTLPLQQWWPLRPPKMWQNKKLHRATAAMMKMTTVLTYSILFCEKFVSNALGQIVNTNNCMMLNRLTVSYRNHSHPVRKAWPNEFNPIYLALASPNPLRAGTKWRAMMLCHKPMVQLSCLKP